MSSQHCFRHGESTVTNLLTCDSYIFNLLNSGKPCDVIMFDFRRAFDKVDHNILCHKLKNIGVDICYLNGSSTISVVVNTSFLTIPSYMWHCNGHFRCVQGNCLGPTLINVFINDLCQSIKHDLKVHGRWCQFSPMPYTAKKKMSMLYVTGHA